MVEQVEKNEAGIRMSYCKQGLGGWVVVGGWTRSCCLLWHQKPRRLRLETSCSSSKDR